uniref:Uncharacterized protein n=1 Tax=Wuchereria bancrofti TaxID=6293 RepID=A0AAF5PR53_WUCBA
MNSSLCIYVFFSEREQSSLVPANHIACSLRMTITPQVGLYGEHTKMISSACSDNIIKSNKNDIQIRKGN